MLLKFSEKDVKDMQQDILNLHTARIQNDIKKTKILVNEFRNKYYWGILSKDNFIKTYIIENKEEAILKTMDIMRRELEIASKIVIKNVPEDL